MRARLAQGMRRARAAGLAGALAATLDGCDGDRRAASLATAFDPDSIPETFTHSTAALMWPGATRAFQITPAGDLYNGEWTVRLSPSSGDTPAGPPRVIAFEGRWLPVARWTRRSGDVRWTFEAVPFPGPGKRDSGLVVSLVARATNGGGGARTARLELALGPPDPHPIFVAFDALASPSPPLAWGTQGVADTVYGWSEGEADGATRRVEWRLSPGESEALRVLLPTYPAPARELAVAARRPHRARAEELRRYWRQALETATRFQLGDPEVEAALAGARVVMLSCRERRGPQWVPIGGPFQYRDVWLRDGARLAQALALAGHTRVARELAAGLARFQWSHGAFLSQRGQPDGTGQALWMFEQTLLRPAADDSLMRFVVAARRAWRWCERQREFGRTSGGRFGLMMPYADPHDGELVRAQLVGTDAWTIAGYRATARLMRAARLDAEAAAVDRAGARYTTDFVAALERTRSRDVPPSWQEVGRDWGNLSVGWPCGVLPAGHPRLAALARRVWGEAGGAGLVTYGHRDSLHDYVGADLGTWALLAGRREQADSVLAALLHWRSASGGSAELFSRAGDFGRNLPPHPTSAAALVVLVRNALLFDDGDTLALTLGARERWWRGASVRRAPTRWGLVDLEFHRDGNVAQWHWSVVPVWTSLSLPPGTRLASVPPGPLRAASATRVLAPPGTGAVRVTLEPVSSAGR